MEEMKEKETVCEAEKENQTEEQPAKKEPKLKKKKDAELEKAREEIALLKDQLLRQMAEFDNYRKRTAKEKASTFDDARVKILTPFVAVLDIFERAAEANCSDEAYKQGILMLLEQFSHALKEQGVEEIAAEGLPLDPTRHQAVMQEEKEGVESGCVANVLQKGYAIGDKVLRTAMVSVAP